MKMVHNGIEYGLTQAYAEGFEIMHASDYKLDLAAISELWMQGSVARSWLLELAGRALRLKRPGSGPISRASWPIWVKGAGRSRRRSTTTSRHQSSRSPLPTRFRSRQDYLYGAKVLAALRNEFGGHPVKTE